MTQPDHASVAAEVARLASLTTDELRVEYERLAGEPARTRNKTWLFRRVAWLYQASVYGGLSEAAQRRLEELMPTAELALRTPKAFRPEATAPTAPIRDSRLPKPGTVLLRAYKGQRIAVTVTKDGFEYLGQTYRSLSAVAHAVTGSHWNGLRFFNIAAKRKATA